MSDSKKLIMKKIVFLFIALLFTLSCTYSQTPDEDAIIKACTDYTLGSLAADGDLIKNSVHPEVNKVKIEYLSKTERSFIRKSRLAELLAIADAKAYFTPEDQRDIEVKVLDIDENIACAMVESSKFLDYCQLVKAADAWKVVNVLWTWNPEKTPPGVQEEQGELSEEMIFGAGMDYIDGAYSGSAERMERALHPELNKVFPYQIPNTDKLFLPITGYQSLIEMTRAGVMNMPEDERKIGKELLDKCGNMALIKMPSAKYIDYCMVGLVNGEAKIINVLWRPVK